MSGLQLDRVVKLLADRSGPLIAEYLAPLVAKEIIERTSPGRVVRSAGEVVQGTFGVGADYVYDHDAELGAQRLGDGPKPRLRFDSERVRAFAEFGSRRIPRD